MELFPVLYKNGGMYVTGKWVRLADDHIIRIKPDQSSICSHLDFTQTREAIHVHDTHIKAELSR